MKEIMIVILIFVVFWSIPLWLMGRGVTKMEKAIREKDRKFNKGMYPK